MHTQNWWLRCLSDENGREMTMDILNKKLLCSLAYIVRSWKLRSVALLALFFRDGRLRVLSSKFRRLFSVVQGLMLRSRRQRVRSLATSSFFALFALFCRGARRYILASTI